MTIGYRIVLWLMLIIGALAVVVGLATEPGGFAGNAWAEAAGVLLGAWLAVTLIETVLNRQRREQWEEVRDEIVRSVSVALLDAVTGVVSATRTGDAFLDAVGTDQSLRVEIADAIALLPDEVKAATDRLAGETDYPVRASSRLTYSVVEIELAPVLDPAITRVVALGDEPKLARFLLALESQARDWRAQIELVETQNDPERLAWQQAVATLRAVSELYSYLAQHP